MSFPVPERCSDNVVEPLPGTAKKTKVYVVLEWPRGWSHDVLDGDTFGPELTEALNAKLGKGASLQLIRRPGREGRWAEKLHLYLVFAEEAVTELLLVDGPDAVLTLDLTGPGRNGGQVVDEPLVLVCTHGKRDVCCAVKGRPLAQSLAQYAPDIVWESSHMKGHRFAPAMLLLPWGYSFGRLNEHAARELVSSAVEGRFFYPGNRGRGTLSAQEQVAELAVAQMLIDDAEPLAFGALAVDEEVVTHPDGRSWSVDVEQIVVDGVIASCGDEPKSSTAWVAAEVTPR